MKVTVKHKIAPVEEVNLEGTYTNYRFWIQHDTIRVRTGSKTSYSEVNVIDEATMEGLISGLQSLLDQKKANDGN